MIEPFASLSVEDPDRAGAMRAVRSVADAAEMLVAGWPKEGRSPLYREALEACYAALDGSGSAKKARAAFIAAAGEVRLFVRDHPT
jgi:hypothetical protein